MEEKFVREGKTTGKGRVRIQQQSGCNEFLCVLNPGKERCQRETANVSDLRPLFLVMDAKYHRYAQWGYVKSSRARRKHAKQHGEGTAARVRTDRHSGAVAWGRKTDQRETTSRRCSRDDRRPPPPLLKTAPAAEARTRRQTEKSNLGLENTLRRLILESRNWPNPSYRKERVSAGEAWACL